MSRQFSMFDQILINGSAKKLFLKSDRWHTYISGFFSDGWLKLILEFNLTVLNGDSWMYQPQNEGKPNPTHFPMLPANCTKYIYILIHSILENLIRQKNTLQGLSNMRDLNQYSTSTLSDVNYMKCKKSFLSRKIYTNNLNLQVRAYVFDLICLSGKFSLSTKLHKQLETSNCFDNATPDLRFIIHLGNWWY